MSIRDLKEEDAKIIFNWANEPGTRANSLNSEPIKWEDHLKWFEAKLKSDKAWFYIVEDASEPCSFVRFEQKEDEKIYIGVVVSENHRGKVIGYKTIALGLEEFFKVESSVVYAQIKKNNIASIKAFEKNNFKLVESGEVLLYKREK